MVTIGPNRLDWYYKGVSTATASRSGIVNGKNSVDFAKRRECCDMTWIVKLCDSCESLFERFLVETNEYSPVPHI